MCTIRRRPCRFGTKQSDALHKFWTHKVMSKYRNTINTVHYCACLKYFDAREQVVFHSEANSVTRCRSFLDGMPSLDWCFRKTRAKHLRVALTVPMTHVQNYIGICYSTLLHELRPISCRTDWSCWHFWLLLLLYSRWRR